MTEQQWEILQAVIEGETVSPLPAGFIIDSPWLPNWAGMTILDYFTSESCWFEANMKAIGQFPEILFLPGFWSEFGMCTEPSAFGAKCRFPEDEFPFAEPVIRETTGFGKLPKPDAAVDGLAPFMLKRLKRFQPEIEAAGHRIRFAVARGPLNIAGFLMGNTEFLMAMKMNPDETHALLDTITAFLEEWAQLQAHAFPSIDGIMFLDDVVGFCGEADFVEFAKPYLTRIFNAVDASVRLFHNDSPGMVCAPHLEACGVNVFNFAYEHPMAEMRKAAGEKITLLGNIPPRDVMAQGTPDQVRAALRAQLDAMPDTRRVILSCGGGMPPGVPNENIRAFLEEAGCET
jgi:uroporphyrinogen-III decarboxylase